MTPAFAPLSEGSAASGVTGLVDLGVDVPVIDLVGEVPQESDLDNSVEIPRHEVDFSAFEVGLFLMRPQVCSVRIGN